MKLPSFKRLQSQDYNKKYNDLTDQLFFVLNPFMDTITQAFNNRITFPDNIDCLDITLDITAPVTSLKVKNTRDGQFRGSQVLSCTNKNDVTDPLVGAPFVQFTSTTDGQLNITNITGLTAGKVYTIRILFQR